jgi:hypothetical protein
MGTIRAQVDEQSQLFNSIDPSPFHKRDLDPQCESFLLAWAREFPNRDPIRIEIRIRDEHGSTRQSEDIGHAVRAHFDRDAQMQNLRVRRLLREGRLSLVVGLSFLALCMAGATLLPFAAFGTAGDVFRESLIIAGWVAMWHPLDVLLYGYWPVLRERTLLHRLAAAEVVITSPT